MFTIKAFARGRSIHTVYEAAWYSIVDEGVPYVQFETPPPSSGLNQIEVGDDYVRVVVENAAGKTVDNIYVSNDSLAEIKAKVAA